MYAIRSYYDNVLEVSASERADMAKAPYNENEYKKSIGVTELTGEKGYSTNERTGIRPSLDVCGIWGGYMGEGAKTVLPSKAFAKISTRLVPNQDYKKIGELFCKHFESIAPESVITSYSIHYTKLYELQCTNRPLWPCRTTSSI